MSSLLHSHQQRFFRQCLAITGGVPLLMGASAALVPGPPDGRTALGFAALVFALLLAYDRWPAVRWVVPHVHAALLLGTGTHASVFVAGGAGCPALYGRPIVPLAIALVSGLPAAAAWTLLCGVLVVALDVFAEAIPPGRLSPETLRLNRELVLLGTLLVGLLVGGAWTAAVRAQRLALAEALERAHAASAAKSAFLATMSHEIRTPWRRSSASPSCWTARTGAPRTPTTWPSSSGPPRG